MRGPEPRTWAIALSLAVAWIVLSFLPAALCESFGYNRWDNFEYFTPILTETHGTLLHGAIPRVNFHQHLGEPMPTNVQAGIFYLPYTLSLVLVRALGLTPASLCHVIIVLHLGSVLTGMFLLLRALGVRASLAFSAAAWSASGGYLIAYSSVFVFLLPVFSWLAWAMLGSVLVLRSETGGKRRELAGGCLVTLSLAALAWAGQMQFLVYAWVFLVLIQVLAARFCYGSFRRMARLLPFEAAAVLLGMPTVLPSYLFLPHTVRSAAFSLADFQSMAATPWAFLGLVSPLFRVDNGFLTFEASPMLHQGALLPALLAGLLIMAAAGGRREPEARPLLRFGLVVLAVCALFAAFALGEKGFVYRFTHCIPVWSSFRWPNKFLLFVNWGLALAGGLAAECLLRGGRGALSMGLRLEISGLLLALLVLGLVCIPSPLLAEPSGKLSLVTGVMLVLCFPWLERGAVPVAVAFLSLLSGIASVGVAQDLRLKDYREAYGSVGAERLGIDPAYRTLPLSHDVIEPERIQEFGQFQSATANGYASASGCTHDLVPMAYRSLLETDLAGVPSPASRERLVGSHLLRSMNVRYLIVGKEDGPAHASLARAGSYEKVHDIDDVEVFRDRVALGRAYFASEVRAFDASSMLRGLVENQAPADAAFVEGAIVPRRLPAPARVRGAAFAPDGRVTIDVEAAKGGFLVLSVLRGPGWRAWVDDVDVTVLAVNSVLMGIEVPAGARRVRFAYEPPGLGLGLVCAVVGLVGLGAWAHLRSQRRQGPYEEGNRYPHAR